uniref:Uncharacterized protein n=1 Tax=Dromaius novaehollandiae TaxID=8790 RepID=A0A8C4J6E2_DRONO
MKVLTSLERYQSLMRPQDHISILFWGWLQHQPMLLVSQQHPQIQNLPPPHQTSFHQPNLQMPAQDPVLSLAGEQPTKHSFGILEIPADQCSLSSQHTQCIGAAPAAGQSNQPMYPMQMSRSAAGLAKRKASPPTVIMTREHVS